MDRKTEWGEGVFAFLDELLEGDLHGKRVLSLANATLGVMVSAPLDAAAADAVTAPLSIPPARAAPMDLDTASRASRRSLLLLGAGALLAPVTAAAAAPPGPAGQVEPTGSGTVAVVGEFEVLPGQQARVLELTRRFAAASRAEPGCLPFMPYRFASNLDRYQIQEVYRDAAVFRDHTAAEHTQAFNRSLATAVFGGASSVSHLVGL